VDTVSSGSARRGRRDNGLDAAEYAAAGDVDPRVGEHLLDVLALQGIAAYLQPAVDLNPVTRSAVMPSRPTDRLFVDRAHLATARDYLAQLAEPLSASPGADDRPQRDQARDDEPWREQARDDRPPGERAGDGATGDERGDEVDDAWAAIVAGYDTEVDTAAASWPEVENIRTERPAEPPADRAEDRPPPPRPTWESQPSLLNALDTFGMDLPDDPDDEEGYTPPPPPPLPRISKYAVLGVLAIIAGFVLFIKPSLLPIDSDVSMLFGFTAILAGFGLLVWRLRPGDDGDDYDPDDGARV
jgi:hypothetical protein